MRTNNLTGLLSLIMIFSFCLNLMGNGAENSANGIYMKVSGKVIQRETGKGVPDIRIDILDDITGESYDGTTDRNGNFVIKMVPQGIYKISEAFIYMSCPEELIVYDMPEIIKVSTGRNIVDINIYLQRGAIISGYVYASDGVTPLKDVEIAADPRLYGKDKSVFTDSQGKYIIKGVGEGDKLIQVSAQGFGLESIGLDVGSGEQFENINFILGKGNVSVKGKIVSEKNNQVVKNAFVFFTYLQPDHRYSAGFAKTDNNGDYSIIGLKFPGIFELSIVHDEYDEGDSHISLNNGENILNLELESKNVSEMVQLTSKNSSAQSKSNTINCDKCHPFYDLDYDSIQKKMCEKLNEKADCIGDDTVLKCLKYRCNERNYTIICVPDCPEPDDCAIIDPNNINIGKKEHAEIYLCTNFVCLNIQDVILHELFHFCDRGGKKSRSSCSDWRDYRSMYCVFGEKSDKYWRNKYKQWCYNCLFKGKNCRE